MKSLSKKIQKHLDIFFNEADFLGKQITLRKLSITLKKFMKEFDGESRVKVEKKIKIGKRLVFSGMFDEGRDVGQQLHLTLHVPKNSKYIFFCPKRFSKFRFLLSQALQHELIHKYQIKSQKKNSIRYIKYVSEKNIKRKRVAHMQYLGEIRELNAYGHDIAMEIHYYYPDIPLKNVLASIHSYKNIITYRLYSKSFRGVEWGNIKKILLKEVKGWYNTITLPDDGRITRTG